MTANVVSSKFSPNTRNKRNIRFRKLVDKAVYYLLGIIASLFFIYPLVWLISASFKPRLDIFRHPLSLIPHPFNAIKYAVVLTSTPLARYMGNSFLYGVASGAFTLFFGILAAYGLSRFNFRGKRNFMIAIILVTLIPGLVYLIPVYVMMSQLHLINSRIGIVLLYGAGGIPGTAFILKGYFDSVPKELDESAWIDGATKFYTLWQILVPMIIPGLAALFILGFIGTWNEYAVASVILKRPDLFPVMVGAKTLVDPDAQDLQLMASLCVMNVVPLIVIFTFVQRYLVSGLTMGSIK